MSNTIYGIEAFEKRAEPYNVVDNDIVRNVDVCVIGSGAAGAVIAQKMAAAGKSVVLLERGGYYDGESMNQREDDMIALLWKNSGANFTSNLKMAVAQGSCLGGSTVINDAVCFRIPDIVVDQWNADGVSISKEEWTKANDEVSARIHVSKVTEEELNENAKRLRKACETVKINEKSITEHRPNERNCGPSWTDPTLESCVKCGFCHLGCHYDTKQSMLVTYIHDAINQTDDFTAYCNCRVEKIVYDGTVAKAVEGSFVDVTGNEKYRIRINANTIVVSAGSIASSNILQRSEIPNENIGNGLAFHPAALVMGHFNDEIYGNRGIPMSYTCHEYGVTNGVQRGGFLIESIFLPIFQMAVAIPSFATEHLLMMREYNKLSLAGVMIRDEPVGKVSKTFGDNPKVDYKISDNTLKDMARGMSILAKLWFGIGADYVISPHVDIPKIQSENDILKLEKAVLERPDGLRLGSAHPQGGNRMGVDSTNSVVDSNCKVHGFDNLYVCDASVFPTALGVNPQLTVMALGAIVADKIIENWQDKEITTSFGRTCSIEQPQYCSMKSLGEMFAVTSHESDLIDELENSKETKIIPGTNWEFDKNTLTIHNNLFWKGFFGRDTDLMTTGMRAFGGFYKKFRKISGHFKGVTKPFEVPVFAKSSAVEKELPGHGKIIHLEYEDLPYNQAYDILKIVDKNHILGKAYLGEFGRGRLLFDFSMSKEYSMEFMGEDDLNALFYSNDYSKTPTKHEMVGKWEGMLVSDSFVTPRSQIFDFNYNGEGEYNMHYNFGNLLRGFSDVSPRDDIFRFDDFTQFHDELRMVRPDIVVGKWVTDWSLAVNNSDVIADLYDLINAGDTNKVLNTVSKLFNLRIPRLSIELGVSFLNVENDPQKGSRIGLGYILRKM